MLSRFYICACFLVASLAFAQNQSQNIPNNTPEGAFYPVLPAQKIGPNDLVSISVYDQPELSRLVRVSSDGSLKLPMLKKQIQAQGLLPIQLEDAIANELKAEQLVLQPIVTVSMAEYRSYSVSVGGEVKNPLTFQAPNPVKLLDAINNAGGLTSDAGPEILVTRPNPSSPDSPGLTQRIPVAGLIDDADPQYNLTLTGGEEVRVPQVGKVYVVGDVKQPGAYPVQGNNETTVLHALALAQGIDRLELVNRNAYIYRRDKDGTKTEIVVNLKEILNRKAPDVPMVAHDLLYVPESNEKRVSLAVLEKVALFVVTGGASAAAYTAIR